MAGLSGDPIEELLPGYALNALEPEEQAMVEEALEREPRYRSLLAEYLEGVSMLSVGRESAIPSARLRGEVMRAVSMTPKAPDPRLERPASVPMAFWGLAAALVLAVVSMGTVAFLQNDRVQDLENEMRDAVNVMQDLTKPDSEQQPMDTLATPLPAEEPPFGRVVSAPNGSIYILVGNLDDAPDDQTYQAWLWRDGVAESITTFEVGSIGQARIPVTIPESEPGTMLGFSVTLEDEDGATTPSPNPILSAQIRMPVR